MKSSDRRGDPQGLRLTHDAELRRIAVLHPSQFTPEVVSLARAELGRRNLPVPTPEEYWRDRPDEWLAAMGFCFSCWAATTDEPPRTRDAVRRVGIGLSGEVDPCLTCGSAVETKALWFWVPILPLGQYRVIRFAAGSVGRRLKSQA